MRSFRIVGNNSSGRYISKTPRAAANKAFTQISIAKNIKQNYTDLITIKETTRGSNNKEYTYKLTRRLRDSPLILNGRTIRYEISGHAIRNNQNMIGGDIEEIPEGDIEEIPDGIYPNGEYHTPTTIGNLHKTKTKTKSYNYINHDTKNLYHYHHNSNLLQMIQNGTFYFILEVQEICNSNAFKLKYYPFHKLSKFQQKRLTGIHTKLGTRNATDDAIIAATINELHSSKEDIFVAENIDAKQFWLTSFIQSGVKTIYTKIHPDNYNRCGSSTTVDGVSEISYFKPMFINCEYMTANKNCDKQVYSSLPGTFQH